MIKIIITIIIVFMCSSSIAAPRKIRRIGESSNRIIKIGQSHSRVIKIGDTPNRVVKIGSNREHVKRIQIRLREMWKKK